MDNKEIIHNFYTAFAEGNPDEMIKYYHDDITFEDPAFGKLKGDRAKNMWQMLLSQKSSTSKISFDNIKASEIDGSANWRAEYQFGDKKRDVVNIISAQFKFKDGKIIEHKDTFDLWTWSKQALGTSGYLLGWSSFMRKKIQKTTNDKLDKFVNRM